jgi:hypothetical protein
MQQAIKWCSAEARVSAKWKLRVPREYSIKYKNNNFIVIIIIIITHLRTRAHFIIGLWAVSLQVHKKN